MTPFSRITLGFFFLCCLRGPVLPAQQLPLFSLYRENQGLLNPASVNPDFLLYQESYRLSFGLTQRSQWIGGAGKTATQTIRGELVGVGEGSFAPLVGAYLVKDQAGPTGLTGVYGRVAGIFGLEHPNFGGFSAGINAGLVNFRVRASQVDLLDPDDVLGQSDYSQWHPDVGLGLYFYKNIERRGAETMLVYAGLSAAQIVAPDLRFREGDQAFPLTRRPHFYALAGVYQFLDAFSFLELSAWARQVANVPLDMDVNIRYQRKQKFWLGAGGGLSGSVHGEFGVYLLQAFQKRRSRHQPLLKLSAGFDYALVSYHNQADKGFEVNLSWIPKVKG